MIRHLAAIIGLELRMLSRNRWVAVITVVMIAFSLLIAFAGSAPVGTVGTDGLTVATASLTTLMVYLVPLVALLLSYDSIAGEASRGTLALLLTYPATRLELLAGKYAAQSLVLAFAIVAGLAAAAAMVAMKELPSAAAFALLLRLAWSSCLLGAAFLAIGNLTSVFAREPGTAAALAIGVWIIAVVMYDVALLGALVSDDGGLFTQRLFPWFLLANPTDAFRLFNLSHIDPGAIAGGMASVSDTAGIPARMALVSLLLWPIAATAAALLLFRRMQP